MARIAQTTKPIRKLRFKVRVNSRVLPSAARIAPPISPARIDIETKPPTSVHEDSDSVIVWPWLASSTGIQPTAPPARPASALKINSRRSTALFIANVLYVHLEPLCADVIPKSAKRPDLLQYNNCNRTRLIIPRKSASLNAGPASRPGSDGFCWRTTVAGCASKRARHLPKSAHL